MSMPISSTPSNRKSISPTSHLIERLLNRKTKFAIEYFTWSQFFWTIRFIFLRYLHWYRRRTKVRASTYLLSLSSTVYLQIIFFCLPPARFSIDQLPMELCGSVLV